MLFLVVIWGLWSEVELSDERNVCHKCLKLAQRIICDPVSEYEWRCVAPYHTPESSLLFASIFDSYFWSCFVRLCFPFLLRLFVLWFLEQRLKLRLFCKPFLPALLQLSLLGAALWATWGLHPLQGFVLFSSVMLFRVNIHWGNNTVEDVTVAKSIFQVLPPVCFYGQG